MLDVYSLECFSAVAREQSINRAAKRLHLSQPAVSRRVEGLEHELGVRLLERRASGVALTPAGVTLLSYADEIRRLTDEARHVVQQISGAAGKSVRVGFYQASAPVLLLLIRLLHVSHPKIRIRATEANRGVLIDALRQGAIDLALPGYVTAEHFREFDGVRLPGPALVFVLPARHRFAARKRLQLSELKWEKFVALDEREFPGYEVVLREHCVDSGFKPRIVACAHTPLEAVAQALAVGGVSVLPRSAVALPLSAPVSLVECTITPESCPLWQAGNGDPALRTIVASLVDAMQLRWLSAKHASTVVK